MFYILFLNTFFLQVLILWPFSPQWPQARRLPVEDDAGGWGEGGAWLHSNGEGDGGCSPGPGQGQTRSFVVSEQYSLILLHRYHLRSVESPTGLIELGSSVLSFGILSLSIRMVCWTLLVVLKAWTWTTPGCEESKWKWWSDLMPWIFTKYWPR